MAYYSGDISNTTATSGNNKSQVGIVSRKKAHSDLNLKLTLHPIRKDIIPLKDDAAIKNAVKNLLLTNFFERPFQPAKGANLRGLLFEPADAITKYELSSGIRRCLEIFEPRIKVLAINVKDESERNSYRINVIFQIIEFDSNQEVEIVLERLR
mgnify:FL=1|tara:strand:+ start:468 stop:929 length:462 start_codon:yes stop_codon:yes gene_type:complete